MRRHNEALIHLFSPLPPRPPSPITLWLHALVMITWGEAPRWLYSHTRLRHMLTLALLTPSPPGFLMPSPKTASPETLIKIARRPACAMEIAHFLVISDTVISQPKDLAVRRWRRHLWPPSPPISSAADTVNTARDSRSTFSRTHVYLVTLCAIFGARAWATGAQHPHQFLRGRDALSRGCRRWRRLTRRLNNLHKLSERETPRGMRWGPAKKRRERRQVGGVMNEKRVRWKLVGAVGARGGWVEVQHLHVDWDTDTHTHAHTHKQGAGSTCVK